jgi:antitoxin PrlF
MADSTITSKGQTTVPSDIREFLGATPGVRLVWLKSPDGSVIVRAKSRTIADVAGLLKAPAGVHVAVGDMNPFK